MLKIVEPDVGEPAPWLLIKNSSESCYCDPKPLKYFDPSTEGSNDIVEN